MEEVVDVASEARAIVGEADVSEGDLAEALTQLPGAKHPWLAPTLVAAALLLFLGLSPSPFASEATLTVLLPAAFVIIVSTFFQRGVRRAWVKQAFANIGGQTTFRFDDYGFTSESSLRQHRLAWASLARALETPKAFLVYTTPRTVLIVPKRAFSDADVPTLSRLLLERITPTPPPKTGLFKASANRTLLLWVVLVAAFLGIWRFLDEGAPPRRHERSKRENAVNSGPPSSGGEASDVDSSP
jgi:YcxB-like protein